MTQKAVVKAKKPASKPGTATAPAVKNQKPAGGAREHYSGKKAKTLPPTPGILNEPPVAKALEQVTNPPAQAKLPVDASKLNFKSLPTGQAKDHGYGVTSASIFYSTSKGGVESSRYKEIRRDGRLVAIATKKYTVLPNEQVIELIKEAGIKDFKVEMDRDGNAMYATIIDERFEGAVEKGDVCRVGTIVSNSIDTSEALSAKLFTYRLACGNGAVGSAKMMGSLFLRHVGDREKLVNQFRQSIDVAISESQKLIEMYRRSLKVKVDEKLAQAIVDVGFARDYLPSNIDYETDKKTHERKAVLKEKDVNFWETFNMMTKQIWHGQSIAMAGKVARTQDLHKIMAKAVAGVAA